MQAQQRPIRHECGFSLVELMVVVGIIGVLVAFVLPMVNKARTAARTTSSTNTINQISQAITQYQADFRGFPGPLAYDEVAKADATATPWPDTTARFPGFELPAASVSGFVTTGTGGETAVQMITHITDSENLVLGLMGGLRVNPVNGRLQFDPSLVGSGAGALNQTAIGKKGTAYISDIKQLSFRDTPDGKNGHYKDDAGEANDSIIPEFVDNYVSPMPILYLRARPSVAIVPEIPAGTPTAQVNSIITYDTATNARPGTFDLHQVIGYTGMYAGTWPAMTLVTDPTMGGGQTIGEGKSLKTSFKNGMVSSFSVPFHGLSQPPNATRVLGPSSNTNYDYPYNAYPYFRNNNLSSPAVPKAVQSTGYVLISAGPDRVYGTSDDITNFGSVAQ